MRVGDLVHAPRYPYWGMGMIVEVGKAEDVLVCWFGGDNNEPRAAEDWHDIDYLEKL
jgi:hypothetical protein